MKEMIERELERIEIPPTLHARCAAGARRAKQQYLHGRIKRLTAVAAALMCVLTLSHPSVAAQVRGFFEDIIRWDGAVTGTAYTPGAGELALRVPDGGSVLEITFAPAEDLPSGEITPLAAGTQILPYGKSEHIASGVRILPFSEIERLAVGARILCADGSVILFSGEADYAGGTASLALPDLPAGECTLVIESLEGLSKADAPLEIRGEWEIGFPSE